MTVPSPVVLRELTERHGPPREVLWRNGAPTEFGIKQFTQGDCWALALVLSGRHGWPLVALEADDHWCHILVQVGRGIYFDVQGFHTLEDLHANWEFEQLIFVDNYAVIDDWWGDLRSDNGQFDNVFPRSRTMATRLVRKNFS